MNDLRTHILSRGLLCKEQAVMSCEALTHSLAQQQVLLNCASNSFSPEVSGVIPFCDPRVIHAEHNNVPFLLSCSCMAWFPEFRHGSDKPPPSPCSPTLFPISFALHPKIYSTAYGYNSASEYSVPRAVLEHVGLGRGSVSPCQHQNGRVCPLSPW